MTQVISFEDFRPAARYDGLPWTEVLVQEAAISTGTWATIDTLTITPVDADPENPALRSFTTEVASDADGLWYRLVFTDATGDTFAPTHALLNTPDSITFTTVSELQRILKLRSPTDEQVTAMQRVLDSAAGEIRFEVDLVEGNVLSGWQLALAAEVNLERAVEHWQQMESPFGIIGLGAEFGATHTARDSWERHALKLVPLKEQWGIA